MIALKITGFQGIKPRVSPRLVGEQVAQIASNCNLISGEIIPLATPELASTNLLSGTPVLKAIYRADGAWLMWDRDVDVARSPIPGVPKFIYSGDGEPRITTEALNLAGARSLGVPKPTATPTVTPAGGALTDVDRFYCYTFYDDYNQESGISPLSTRTTGKPDGTWTVAAMDTQPLSAGTGTVTVAAGPPAVTTFTNGASVKHWLRVGDEVVIDATTVLVSEVTSLSVFKVIGDFTGALTWARKTPWGSTFTKNIYRTSGTKAQFQLVANIASATVSYNDTILDKDTPGDELISASWELPPTDLKGMMALPTGALCGFSGNEICFSEPFQPHAWPPEYRMKSTYPVVAVGQYSSGIVVGTSGVPLIIMGHEPGQMNAQPAEGANPCLSKRSMVSLGDSVTYATAHGMFRIGDSGTSLITQDWLSRDEWAEYGPETMIVDNVRGRLYIMTQGHHHQVPQLLIFDFLDQTGMTSSDIDGTELFADAITGKLYISEVVNKDIREFDPPDGFYMQQDWQSKEFVVPKPVNLGAARVSLTSRYSLAQVEAIKVAYAAAVVANDAMLIANAQGGLLGDDSALVGELDVASSLLVDLPSTSTETPGVNFTLYVDGVAAYEKIITDSKGFPLPSGYKSDTFSVRVQGQSLVKSIDLAETLSGLANA